MKQYNTYKRDEFLINLLKKYRGSSNLISGEQIAIELNNNGFSLNKSSVHTILKAIMYDYNVPIGSINCKGYYWITSKTDVEKSIKHLETRRDALNDRINHLKSLFL